MGLRYKKSTFLLLNVNNLFSVSHLVVGNSAKEEPTVVFEEFLSDQALKP